MFYLLYIYMCVRCKARTQTNTRRPLPAVEMGAPVTICAASRHDQPRPDDIMAHTDRNPSPMTRAASRHEQPHTERHPGRTTLTDSGRPMGAPSSTAGTPRAPNSAPMVPSGHHRPPRCASEYTYKFRLTLTIPMGCRAAVALSWSRFVQNINSL